MSCTSSTGRSRDETRLARFLDQTDALQWHGLQVLATSPLVLHGVLNVCHPSPAVITEPPGRLEALPPLTPVLNLDRARRVVPVLFQEADDGRHTDDLPQRGHSLVHPFE